VMDWQSELDELHKRENLARAVAGLIKLNASMIRAADRTRAHRWLLDAGTFHEVGTISGKGVYDDDGELIDFIPANCLFGRGMIDGRPVVVSGDDFLIRGGSADASIREKSWMAEQMAYQYRLPIIRIIEGSGAADLSVRLSR